MRTKINIKHNAFTLAEMMVVLLILSIILAAFAPVMTTRFKRNKVQASTSSIWKYTSSNDEIYYGTAADNVVMIGQNNLEDTDTPSRLIINASGVRPNHILLKKDNSFQARLAVDTKNNYLFTSTNANEIIDTGTENSVMIGNGAVTNANKSIAIGHGVKAYGKENNIAIGYQAMGNGTKETYFPPEKNIAIGYQALFNLKDEETGNIAIGTQALKSDKNGNQNIAIGKGVAFNSDASGSVAIGGSDTKINGQSVIAIGKKVEAGKSTTEEGIFDSSIAMGYNAKATYYSIAVGSGASSSSSVSADSDSVALGYNANAAAGEFTSEYEGDTRGNIAIGSNSQTFNYRNIAIGYNAIANSKNSIAIGYNANTSGNGGDIVIGTGSFSESISNDLNYSNFIIGNNKVKGYSNIIIGSKSNSSGTVFCNYEGVNNVISIGAGCPSDLKSNSIYLGNSNHKNNFNLSGTKVDFTKIGPDYSDRRLKNILSRNFNGLEKIKQLKTYNFTFKKDNDKEPHVGVIAQDLQKVFPNSVKKDREGYLYIRRDEMFYAMINAVKEIDVKLASIENLLKNLKDKIVNFKNENVILKEEIKQLRAENAELDAKIKHFEKLVK